MEDDLIMKNGDSIMEDDHIKKNGEGIMEDDLMKNDRSVMEDDLSKHQKINTKLYRTNFVMYDESTAVFETTIQLSKNLKQAV